MQGYDTRQAWSLARHLHGDTAEGRRVGRFVVENRLQALHLDAEAEDGALLAALQHQRVRILPMDDLHAVLVLRHLKLQCLQVARSNTRRARHSCACSSEATQAGPARGMRVETRTRWRDRLRRDTRLTLPSSSASSVAAGASAAATAPSGTSVAAAMSVPRPIRAPTVGRLQKNQKLVSFMDMSASMPAYSPLSGFQI